MVRESKRLTDTNYMLTLVHISRTSTLPSVEYMMVYRFVLRMSLTYISLHMTACSLQMIGSVKMNWCMRGRKVALKLTNMRSVALTWSMLFYKAASKQA